MPVLGPGRRTERKAGESMRGSMILRNLAAIVLSILASRGAPSALGNEESGRDLTLGEAVAIALENSLVLEAAAGDVEAASAGVRRARAGFLPRLDLQESFTRADNPV